MGVKVFSVNVYVDGYFLGRKLELRYENIVYFGKLVRELGVDFVIVQDGDVDRIVVFDEKGNYVDEDIVIVFFVKFYVEEYGGGIVVVLIDMGLRIDVVVERVGGRVVRILFGQFYDGIK